MFQKNPNLIMQKVIQRIITTILYIIITMKLFFSGKLFEFGIFFLSLLIHILNINISQSSQNLLESSVELLEMLR